MREIRASFYRKLFLAFVAATVVPVLMLALLVRAYFANQLHNDVEAEAARTALTARRVIEESLALQQRDAVGPSTGLSDDVMVWISRVIDQDVNIFDGSRLLVTSERDLFESGLLPTRTPARVYQAVAIERLPTYVGQDRIGDLPTSWRPRPCASPTAKRFSPCRSPRGSARSSARSKSSIAACTSARSC